MKEMNTDTCVLIFVYSWLPQLLFIAHLLFIIYPSAYEVITVGVFEDLFACPESLRSQCVSRSSFSIKWDRWGCYPTVRGSAVVDSHPPIHIPAHECFWPEGWRCWQHNHRSIVIESWILSSICLPLIPPSTFRGMPSHSPISPLHCAPLRERRKQRRRRRRRGG